MHLLFKCVLPRCDIYYLFLSCCVSGEREFLKTVIQLELYYFLFSGSLSQFWLSCVIIIMYWLGNILGWDLHYNEVHCIKIFFCDPCQVRLHHTSEKWYFHQSRKAYMQKVLAVVLNTCLDICKGFVWRGKL